MISDILDKLLNILKVLSKINLSDMVGYAFYERQINLMHIALGIFFYYIYMLILNKKVSTEQVVNGIKLLGIAMIIVHFIIIVTYYIKNLTEEEAPVDTTGVPVDTTGVPVGTTGAPVGGGETEVVKEEYATTCVRTGGVNWFFRCCSGKSNWFGSCI